VEDTLSALQTLAAWYRSQFTLPVIGITGSVGKTTTKEMIAAVLETGYKTLKTEGNQNSQIGVSLMMFGLEEDTEIAVFEMGISMPGEMDKLVDIARPTAAVMTNIGVSHIGNLGTRENICREKGKIIKNFQEDGVLYVCGNGDLKELSKANIPYDICEGNCRTFYYGMDSDTFYADAVETDADGQRFVYHHGEISYPVQLSVMGSHNVCNAVAALALAEQFRIDTDKAVQALLSYRPIAMRGVVKEAGSVHVIDDTYNASPDSIKSNLNALFDYEGGNKIAVLADVLELGERSKELHEEIGRFILSEAEKGRKLSLLVTVGNEAEYIHNLVKNNSDIPAVHCMDNQLAARTIKEKMAKGDWILVKGSRGMHMDEVVQELVKG
jgi:UDP-N-acetylmuramoyl-tripeptide--D-alanyl-D-alanine ligase